MSRNRHSPEAQAFYAAYMKSAAWKAYRARRLALAGGRCEWMSYAVGQPPRRCPSTAGLHVHHETYERLGAEEDHDTRVLCWLHHYLEHLLYKKCACGQPCLDNDEVGETWLRATLYAMNVSETETRLQALPTKEVLLAEVPDMCSACCFSSCESAGDR